MPHIYPLVGQRHTDLTRELTELGGEPQKTFRMAFAWDGEHFFEVTENPEGIDLYEQWISSHSESAAEVEIPTDPVTPSSPPEPPDETTAPAPTLRDAPPLPKSPDSDNTVDNTDSEVGETGTESQKQSPDVAAEHNEETGAGEGTPDVTDGQSSNTNRSAKREPSTTGTTRKRSAKNSNRRS